MRPVDDHENHRGILGPALFAGANALIVLRIVEARPFLGPDSASYLDNAFVHPPAYPLFLDVLKFLFGEAHLYAAIVIQGVFLMVCAGFGGFVFKRMFSLGWGPFFLVWLVLALPLVLPGDTYLSMSATPFQIGTEPVAYELLLAGASFAAVFCMGGQARALRLCLVFFCLAASVRPQYLFLYPAGAVLVAADWFRARDIRRAAVSALFLAGLFFASFTAEGLYHRLVHGRFATAPMTGLHLVAHRLYVAGPEDAALFDDPKQRRLFEAVARELLAGGRFATQREAQGPEASTGYPGCTSPSSTRACPGPGAWPRAPARRRSKSPCGRGSNPQSWLMPAGRFNPWHGPCFGPIPAKTSSWPGASSTVGILIIRRCCSCWWPRALQWAFCFIKPARPDGGACFICGACTLPTAPRC